MNVESRLDGGREKPAWDVREMVSRTVNERKSSFVCQTSDAENGCGPA